MSEDERIEAEKKASKMKTIEESEDEEEEDPQMLLREAKDWKVWWTIVLGYGNPC